MNELSYMAQDVVLLDALLGAAADCYSRMASATKEHQKIFSASEDPWEGFDEMATLSKEAQTGWREVMFKVMAEETAMMDFLNDNTLECMWLPKREK